MKDCRITLTVRNNKVGMEGEDIGMVEFAELCGAMQVLAGTRALALGADIDTVKDNMLDVHLAAMRIVEEQEGRIRNGS